MTQRIEYRKREDLEDADNTLSRRQETQMMSQKKNFVRAPLEKANRERSLHKEENYDRIMEKREQ